MRVLPGLAWPVSFDPYVITKRINGRATYTPHFPDRKLRRFF